MRLRMASQQVMLLLCTSVQTPPRPSVMLKLSSCGTIRLQVLALRSAKTLLSMLQSAPDTSQQG